MWALPLLSLWDLSNSRLCVKLKGVCIFLFSPCVPLFVWALLLDLKGVKIDLHHYSSRMYEKLFKIVMITLSVFLLFFLNDIFFHFFVFFLCNTHSRSGTQECCRKHTGLVTWAGRRKGYWTRTCRLTKEAVLKRHRSGCLGWKRENSLDTHRSGGPGRKKEILLDTHFSGNPGTTVRWKWTFQHTVFASLVGSAFTFLKGLFAVVDCV